MKLDRLNRKEVRSKEATQPLTELTEDAMKNVGGGSVTICSAGHLSYLHQID
jgi:hypothetical protein